MAIDRAAPFTAFDGSFGSVLLGRGWASYQRDYGNRFDRILDRPLDFAWTLDAEAWIHFERPDVQELDFFAVVMPFPHAEERQELVLSVGGRELGRRELDGDWQEVRVPLREIGAGWKRMRLAFRYAVQPGVVNGAPDDRRLSAAFRHIALVPRQVEDAAEFAAATRLDGAGRLRLARGAVASVPLPAASELTLHLGRLAAPGSDGWDCRLRLDLEAWGKDLRTLFVGTAADATRRSRLSFSTPEGGPCRLRLTVDGCGRRDDPGAAIEIPFTRDLLSLRRAASRRPRGRPHVFIYMIDTLRSDALTVFGSGRPASPRIAEFAQDAVSYHDVWSPSAWTLPSVISVMTGVYPDRHRVSLDLAKLREGGFPTLAERLSSEGYATVAVSQSFIISGKFGLHRGFGHSFYLSDQLGGSELRSQEVRSYLLHWLLHRWEGERPIFAYLHTVDPHAPYRPSASDMRFARGLPATLADDRYSSEVFLVERYPAGSPEVEQLRARYDGEVAYADREFGRFLDMLRYLGLYDDSMVVLVSDHGEEFGEHGAFDHGRTVYEEMLQVPLIVKYPGSQGAGTRVESPVSTVDLVPTILDWTAGEPSGETLDGVVLPPFDTGAERSGRRFVYSEVKTLPSALLAAVHLRALRIGGVKCIESVSGIDQYDRPVPRWRGFDLAEDPNEERPLEDEDPRLARCREAMIRWTTLRSPTGLGEASSMEDLDEATLERLRALGYVE